MALLIKDLVFIYQPYLERLNNGYIFVLLYICKVKLLIRAQLFAAPWSAPSSSIHGIFKARVLEWVAISFFRESSQPRDRTQVSHIVDRRFATDAFELWCWRRLLRVPWTARRSNQSILKEIGPGCSLEGMMLKLKLQYFGHLM